MKLSVEKKELQEKLARIQDIAVRKPAMPVLAFCLLDVNQGGASVMATDNEVFARLPLEAVVEEEGRFCLPAELLYKVASLLPDGKLVVESNPLKPGLEIRASDKRVRFGDQVAPEELPSWPELAEPQEMKLDSSMLGRLLEKTFYAAGEGDTRYTLNGLLFHFSGDALALVGTDGHRMAIISRPHTRTGEELKAILPRKICSVLEKFLDGGEVPVVIGKEHILFKIGGGEFMARLVEGTYPDYDKVVPLNNDKELVCWREDFINALQWTSGIGRRDAPPVKLELGPMSVKCSSTDCINEAECTFDGTYEGEPLTVGFNAQYLLEVLERLESDMVRMTLSDFMSAVLLEGDDAGQHIVMPVKF